MKNAERPYDLILFGASGYTGGLTADYLAREGGKDLRWALAGRNPDKLAVCRERLAAIDPLCANMPLLEVDLADAEALRGTVASARVVISTIGPYILHGEPLVAACAAEGTDYVDLSGEPEFVDQMWLRYQQAALLSGARLVHCCGFDSVPHDLGAWYTVQQLPENTPLTVRGYVSLGGSFSAGTYHSVVHAFSRAGEYSKARRARRARRAREPVPAARRIGGAGGGLQFSDELDAWLLPCPTVDAQIVRRSARALERYGPDFRYSHFIQVRKMRHLAGLLGGAGALFLGAQFGPSREWLLSRRRSGQGPSPEQRAKGWFRVRFVGETRDASGARVVTEVRGGDPGYGDTAKMLAESALCLAFDALPALAGQLTTAVAMGNALIARLRRAGIDFELLEAEPPRSGKEPA